MTSEKRKLSRLIQRGAPARAGGFALPRAAALDSFVLMRFFTALSLRPARNRRPHSAFFYDILLSNSCWAGQMWQLNRDWGVG
jgi:hypothetical protein